MERGEEEERGGKWKIRSEGGEGAGTGEDDGVNG